MAKVLLVTDYTGNLHITPVGNKTYYQSRNKVIKDKQYKFKEVDEDEANKFVEENLGIDPNFKTPAQTNKVIEDKESEIAQLRKDLEEARKNNPEVEKLRQQLLEMSTASTSSSAGGPSDYQKAGANAVLNNSGTGTGASDGSGAPETAESIIAKIKAATTADEVNTLVPATETRKTVTDAMAKKLQEFAK